MDTGGFETRPYGDGPVRRPGQMDTGGFETRPYGGGPVMRPGPSMRGAREWTFS